MLEFPLQSPSPDIKDWKTEAQRSQAAFPVITLTRPGVRTRCPDSQAWRSCRSALCLANWTMPTSSRAHTWVTCESPFRLPGAKPQSSSQQKGSRSVVINSHPWTTETSHARSLVLLFLLSVFFYQRLMGVFYAVKTPGSGVRQRWTQNEWMWMNMEATC